MILIAENSNNSFLKAMYIYRNRIICFAKVTETLKRNIGEEPATISQMEMKNISTERISKSNV